MTYLVPVRSDVVTKDLVWERLREMCARRLAQRFEEMLEEYADDQVRGSGLSARGLRQGSPE